MLSEKKFHSLHCLLMLHPPCIPNFSMECLLIFKKSEQALSLLLVKTFVIHAQMLLQV